VCLLGDRNHARARAERRREHFAPDRIEDELARLARRGELPARELLGKVTNTSSPSATSRTSGPTAMTAPESS
jgi:hypothetical protein